MIKINKDLKKIPFSLSLTATKRPATTTQLRRKEVIESGYIDDQKYSSRYKLADVKKELLLIYNDKCAYCEGRSRTLEVEHFRPKSSYPWLAYSWDNLLLACKSCNSKKKAKFEIEGTRATYKSEDFSKLHSLEITYNVLEKPLLINPEREDAKALLSFDENGKIIAKDENKRMRYTIDTCNLNDDKLCDWRKEVWDELEADLQSLQLEQAKGYDVKNRIIQLIKKFGEQANNKKKEYRAFRYYVIQNFIAKYLV